MSSKRETFLAAVKTALAGTSGVSTRIYRSRVEAFTRAETPALIIEPVNDVADNPTTYRIEWTLTFQVTVILRDDATDSEADATIMDVHSKIMSSSTLQNMCVNLMPAQVAWQFYSADKPLTLAAIQFRASYQTDANSLS